MGLISSAIMSSAKDALSDAIKPFVADTKDLSIDAAKDSIRGALMGKMSIEDWANIIIDSVDSIKKKVVDEEGLTYVGGKMKFTPAEAAPNSVNISFQLYFIDEEQKWYKAGADTNLPAGNFKSEDLEELSLKKEIAFEVE